MKSLAIFIVLIGLLPASSFSAEWKFVRAIDGVAVKIGYVINSQIYTPDPANNEYPMDYVFPVEDMMYWKKVGNDWVAMTAGEKLVVDEAKKQKTLDEAVADVNMEALLKAIAESIKNNDKTFEAVKANFKASVDPVKADKKEKEKK